MAEGPDTDIMSKLINLAKSDPDALCELEYLARMSCKYSSMSRMLKKRVSELLSENKRLRLQLEQQAAIILAQYEDKDTSNDL